MHAQKVSPASNGGCGLKLHQTVQEQHAYLVSPASNGGCGLKLTGLFTLGRDAEFHPPVMAGVD